MNELLPFNENLDNYMKARRVLAADLAIRIGVTAGAVSRWRSKGHLPTAQDLLAIARVLDVTPFELAGSSFVEPEAAVPRARPGRRPKSPLDQAISKTLPTISRQIQPTPPTKEKRKRAE